MIDKEVCFLARQEAAAGSKGKVKGLELEGSCRQNDSDDGQSDNRAKPLAELAWTRQQTDRQRKHVLKWQKREAQSWIPRAHK